MAKKDAKKKRTGVKFTPKQIAWFVEQKTAFGDKMPSRKAFEELVSKFISKFSVEASDARFRRKWKRVVAVKAKKVVKKVDPIEEAPVENVASEVASAVGKGEMDRLPGGVIVIRIGCSPEDMDAIRLERIAILAAADHGIPENYLKLLVGIPTGAALEEIFRGQGKGVDLAGLLGVVTGDVLEPKEFEFEWLHLKWIDNLMTKACRGFVDVTSGEDIVKLFNEAFRKSLDIDDIERALGDESDRLTSTELTLEHRAWLAERKNDFKNVEVVPIQMIQEMKLFYEDFEVVLQPRLLAREWNATYRSYGEFIAPLTLQALTILQRRWFREKQLSSCVLDDYSDCMKVMRLFHKRFNIAIDPIRLMMEWYGHEKRTYPWDYSTLNLMREEFAEERENGNRVADEKLSLVSDEKLEDTLGTVTTRSGYVKEMILELKHRAWFFKNKHIFGDSSPTALEKMRLLQSFYEEFGINLHHDLFELGWYHTYYSTGEFVAPITIQELSEEQEAWFRDRKTLNSERPHLKEHVESMNAFDEEFGVVIDPERFMMEWYGKDIPKDFRNRSVLSQMRSVCNDAKKLRELRDPQFDKKHDRWIGVQKAKVGNESLFEKELELKRLFEDEFKMLVDGDWFNRKLKKITDKWNLLREEDKDLIAALNVPGGVSIFALLLHLVEKF